MTTELMVAGVALIGWAFSDAIGESKRFKANSTIRLLCQAMAGAFKNVLTSYNPIVRKGMELAEPIIEKEVETLIDKPVFVYETHTVPKAEVTAPVRTAVESLTPTHGEN